MSTKRLVPTLALVAALCCGVGVLEAGEGPGPINTALSAMFGGPIRARNATPGQTIIRQADGSWAPGNGAASSGTLEGTDVDITAENRVTITGTADGTSIEGNGFQVLDTNTNPHIVTSDTDTVLRDGNNHGVITIDGNGVDISGDVVTINGTPLGAGFDPEVGNASIAVSNASGGTGGVESIVGANVVRVHDLGIEIIGNDGGVHLTSNDEVTVNGLPIAGSVSGSVVGDPIVGPGPVPDIWHDAARYVYVADGAATVGIPDFGQGIHFRTPGGSPEWHVLDTNGGSVDPPTFRADADGAGHSGWEYGVGGDAPASSAPLSRVYDTKGTYVAVFRCDVVNTQMAICGMNDTDGSDHRFLEVHSDGKIQLRWYNGGTDTRFQGSVLSINTTYVVRAQSDGSTIRIFVNGVEQTITPSSGSNTGQWLLGNTNKWSLGGAVTDSFGHVVLFDGKIMEARYYSQFAFDDVTGAALDAFLMSKWGVP